jgi:feruloyl esterase
LPAEKAEAIQKIFHGPHDSNGKALYSPWPFDTGDAAEGWRAWITGVGQRPAINVLIFPSFFNGLALAGKPPAIDIFKVNFDTDPPRIDKASGDINATATDWSGFRTRGNKLLLYTGVSDPVFSALDLIRYYRQIEQNNGGEEQTHGFARLFLVPGMTHCSGGPGLDDFDALDAMQKWVEEGKAPDSIVASGRAFPHRTRPLCAYPLIAKYEGKGDPEDARSFSCKLP